MRGLLVLLLALCASAVYGQAFHVQRVLLDEEQSLDSAQDTTWWITAEPIDIEAQSRDGFADYAAPGANASPTRVEDRPGTRWTPAKVPNHTQLASHPAGYAWLRKTFYLEKLPAEDSALRLGVLTDSDRTYVNGRLVAQTGLWDSSAPQAYDVLRLYRLPRETLRLGTNVILIQCKVYFLGQAGIQKDRTAIGPALQMFKDFYFYNFRETAFLIVYFTAGCYFMFLFARRRKERENLFFGIFSWDLVVYQFLRTQFKNILGWDFLFWKKVEYIALFLLIPLFYFFLRSYFQIPRKRWVRIWDALTGAIAALYVLLSAFVAFSNDVRIYNQLNMYVAQPVWLILIAGALAVVGYRIVKGDRDAVFMVVGLAFIMVSAGLDVASNRGWINAPSMTGFVFIFFVMSLALVLANRFVRVNEQVEDLNRNLEVKVSERTLELNNTLSEVRALKIQQDGDYFLTSLLLKPLNGIHGISETVNAEMFIEQKKQFIFKKWTAEIGGDVVSTYSVSLRGKIYTAAINADAMGKSIQGAGGALVLGTVFKNVVARSQQGELLSGRYPEQWLKECFVELQNVFVSFDGSMMVSAVLGLVDDESGVLYYINAEHPFTVLYRNGKASFIEQEDNYLRKIGIQGLDGALSVSVLQLLPGDSIIMGSDGRDDLAVGQDSSGMRIINEDTGAFLDAVEQARAELEPLVRVIKARGEVTDDLSLLRIVFRGKAPTKQIQTDRGESIDSLRTAHEANPADSKILFQLAKAMRREVKTASDALVAAELAERLRLREPRNTENLRLLGELHQLAGNEQRAAYYFARAETSGA